MAGPNVTEYLFCRPTLGGPFTDTFQPADYLDGTRLLDAFFGRFQALQKGLRQTCALRLWKGERFMGELLDRGGHGRGIVCGAQPVKKGK